MTYFSLLNCQESEAHVIPQMTTLKKFQLSLRHAHGSHAARAAYSPEQYIFQCLCFFARFYSGFYFSYDTRVMSNVIVKQEGEFVCSLGRSGFMRVLPLKTTVESF